MMKKVMNLFRKNTDHTKNIPDFPDIGVSDDSDEDNIILPRENDSDDSDNDGTYDENPIVFTNHESEYLQVFYYLNERHICENFIFYDKNDAKIHLIMYAVNGQCYHRGTQLPFLQFLVSPDHSFLSFDFHGANRDFNIDENTYFKNECLQVAISNIVLEGHLDKTVAESIGKSYCGFLEIDDHNLAVIFNMTDFMTYYLRNGMQWVGLRELRSHDDPFMTHFFSKYRYMSAIVDRNNHPAIVPENVYLYNIETRKYMIGIHDWLEPRSHHPKYGNFYYFTTTPPRDIRGVRAVLFPMNVSIDDNNDDNGPYELVENSQCTDYISSSDDEMPPTLTESSDYPFASMVYFEENCQSFYCVKNESLFAFV
jgi:hypothetical protein